MGIKRRKGAVELPRRYDEVKKRLTSFSATLSNIVPVR